MLGSPGGPPGPDPARRVAALLHQRAGLGRRVDHGREHAHRARVQRAGDERDAVVADAHDREAAGEFLQPLHALEGGPLVQQPVLLVYQHRPEAQGRVLLRHCRTKSKHANTGCSAYSGQPIGSEIIWNAPTKGVFMVFLKFESAMTVTELRAAELLTDRDSRDTPGPGRSFHAAASMSSVWCLLSVTGLCSCISIIILHCINQVEILAAVVYSSRSATSSSPCRPRRRRTACWGCATSPSCPGPPAHKMMVTTSDHVQE